MKTLVVEDDFASRKLMQLYLSPYGECDVVVDGKEAVEAFELSLLENEPYDLICLDIMLPKKDGQQVLKEIREMESRRNILGSDAVKVLMTTALGDAKNVMEAFRSQCEGYIQKPVSREKLTANLKELKLIEH